MKKKILLVTALLLTATFLFGCSAKSFEGMTGGSSNGMGAVMDSVSSESLSKPGESGSTSITHTPPNQKLIRKVRINAETENLDTLLTQIEQRISELSGYVQAREVYNGSSTNSRRYRNATLTIRIPADKLDVFVNHISENSNITSTNETADDITLTYVATQSRITALETEQTRLLELLAKAETMDDLLQIESRLTDVRTELEEVTSQLKLYDNLVDYGTIYLTLSEVREYTVTEEPETVWERIGTGFMESLKNLGQFFTELFILIIVALPYLIPIAVIILAIILIVKFNRKKQKKQKETKPE